jgi:tRNA A-37 threonylcarbamoyl transferase component Bud32
MVDIPRATSGAPSARDLTDLLLRHLALGDARSATVEPLGVGHAIRIDGGDGYVTRAEVSSSLGNAVAARLAIIADLEVGSSATQLGRVRVALREPESGPSPTSSEFVVAVRTIAADLSAEIHRMATTWAPASLPDASGAEREQASGRYHLKRELGRGGMGIVYLGEHVVLQKEVAIKVLHAGATLNPVLTAQFVVEARAACRARHPGIVDVTDFGTLPDGRAYIAMELVEGPTLSAVIEAEGPLHPRRILVLAARIADALHAAGARGVVHRDLTPSNIFVCSDDRPKIGDFGVAKLIDADAKDEPNQTVGTAGYMAPEQGLGEAVDGRSDVYSLGCVMYRMVTGVVPFTGKSLYTILLKHLNDAPPPMESPHGAVPEELSRIILRALAKTPSDRYQTAGEMFKDLQEASSALYPTLSTQPGST